MKLIKLFAIIVGTFALAFSTTSCKKDDDSKECCTFTDEGETYKYCEGDAEVTEELEEYDMTWSEYKILAEGFADATCD